MSSIKLSEISVVRCYMRDEMKRDAMKILQKAMNRFTEEREVASFIKSYFDSHHHTHWHCIVGKHFDWSERIMESCHVSMDGISNVYQPVINLSLVVSDAAFTVC
ncbi:dynein light chain LC8-type [Schistosoma bovis]|uniref:Dynein light chain n=1 Tax=Schistosoma bovis TaxID=6184 RepID=A0A430Q0B9_SCHBO|nr:dynein light chain LC8-type [Schistosoma bovis]